GRDPAHAGAVGRAAYSLHVADAPWRCSQCGTVNEPVANACRTCGRWPSLFELEGSTLEADAPTATEPDLYEPEVAETDYLEPEVYEPGEPDDVYEGVESEEHSQPRPLWQRLTSLVVPIAVVLYIVISALANRDGG
ncbi:MAG: hypothetical protein ACRDOP_08200, partial [Gaiellaceae bacterium]